MKFNLDVVNLGRSTAEGATAGDQDALRSTASVTRPTSGVQRTVLVEIARTSKEAKRYY